MGPAGSESLATSIHMGYPGSTTVPNRNQNQANQGREESRGRGFAGMDPQQQREIASEGGRAAHARVGDHGGVRT